MLKKLSIFLTLILTLVLVVIVNSESNSSSISDETVFASPPEEIRLTYSNIANMEREIKEIKIQYTLGIKPMVTPHQVLTQGNVLIIKFPLLVDGSYQVKSDTFEVDFIVGESYNEKLVLKPELCLVNEDINTGCLSKYYEDLTVKSGPVDSLKNLGSFIKNNPETIYICHDWTHAIGVASAGYYQNFEIAFGKGTPACQYGYYHGVQEGFAMRMGNNQLKALVPNLCNLVSFGYNAGSCIHGVGHMVWYRTNGDFLESIEYCKLLPATESDMYRPRDACAAGVAMNWGDKYRYGSKEVKKTMQGDMKDPTEICQSILDDPRLRAGCYGFIGHVWSANKEGILHLVDICQGLPAIESRGCWLNVGFEIAFIPDATLEEAISTCGVANTDPAMWSCLGNVVSQSTVATMKKGAAKKACELAKSNKRYDSIKCKEMIEQENARLDPAIAEIFEHIHIK